MPRHAEPADALIGAAPLITRWLERVLAPLTLNQFLVLRALAREPVEAGELARRAGVTAAAMSQLVASLEADGLVAPRPTPRPTSLGDQPNRPGTPRPRGRKRLRAHFSETAPRTPPKARAGQPRTSSSGNRSDPHRNASTAPTKTAATAPPVSGLGAKPRPRRPGSGRLLHEQTRETLEMRSDVGKKALQRFRRVRKMPS